MSKNKAESNALTPKTGEQRQSWLSLAFVQAGICVCIPSFLEGALLAGKMPFWEAIASGTVGYVIVVVIMSVLGFMGSDLGLASCSLAESTFGRKGARYIISVVYAINLVGWFGINNQECAQSFSNFMMSSFNIHIPVAASGIGWGLIMLLTAVFGMSAIEKLNVVSIPLLLAVMFAGTVIAVQQFGLSALDKDVPRSMSFMGGVALSFDFYAVGTITAADITRFQKSRKDTVKSTVLGVFPMGVITLVLGAMLTKMTTDYDISSVLITIGLPVFGVISLILSAWTTNVSNAYSAGLNFVMAFNAPDNRRREVTVAAGIVSIILGLCGILTRVEDVLSMLAYLVCPVGGIMFVDYFIIGKGKAKNWHSVEGWNLVGVAAWIVSVIISFALKIDYLGIVVSAIIYAVIEHFVPSLSREENIREAKND